MQYYLSYNQKCSNFAEKVPPFWNRRPYWIFVFEQNLYYGKAYSCKISLKSVKRYLSYRPDTRTDAQTHGRTDGRTVLLYCLWTLFGAIIKLYMTVECGLKYCDVHAKTKLNMAAVFKIVGIFARSDCSVRFATPWRCGHLVHNGLLSWNRYICLNPLLNLWTFNCVYSPFLYVICKDD